MNPSRFGIFTLGKRLRVEYLVGSDDPVEIDPARIVAVRLVDLLRRQQSLHVPRRLR
jgi:hypothetical protein